MENCKLVPELRFSEFSSSENNLLKTYNFNKIFLFSTGKNIKQGEASPSFETPCVRYGELYHMYNEVIKEIINRTNIDKSELCFSEGNEILLPSAGEDPLDIGSASALTIKNIAIGRTINILKPQFSNLYSHIFVSYYINQKLKRNIARLAKGVSISNVYNSDLKKLSINLPTIAEQQKVAKFLSSVDKRIQLLEERKEKLQSYKKGVMQQIFSQQIRFKQDDGCDFPEWEDKKLGEVTTKTGKKNKNSTKYPVYSINNIEGFIPQNEQFVGVENKAENYDISLYKIIYKNTFAYNPARINVGSIGYSGELNEVIISSLYVCFKTSNKIYDKFLAQYIKYPKFRKDVIRNTEGGVRQYLFYENFARIKINIPSLEEQKLIADFLQKIDNKVSIAQTQIDKTKEFKKGLLQKMFV